MTTTQDSNYHSSPQDTLKKCLDLIKTRGAAYGNLNKTFQSLSESYKQTLGSDLSPSEICMLMTLQKFSRLQNLLTHSGEEPIIKDTCYDLINYLAFFLHFRYKSKKPTPSEILKWKDYPKDHLKKRQYED